MNGLGKPVRKIPIKKSKKLRKNYSKIAACEQKATIEKANFSPFCHSTLKLVRKNTTPSTHLLFCSISCFSVTTAPI